MVLKSLQVDFMRKDQACTKVFKLLAEHEDEAIFANPTIDILVNRVWELHYPRIVKFVFVPYLLYAACFIGYMIFFFTLQTHKDGTKIYLAEPTIAEWPLLVAASAYSALQLLFEVRQFM